MSAPSRILASLSSLGEWIDMQKKAINMFKEINEGVKSADRLSLVLLTRQAFQHMIKTLKAFDQWLNDPFILNYITKDMLEDVWSTTYKLLNELLLLDIRHTQAVKEVAEKTIREGKLPPMIELRGGREEGAERRTLFPL
ncbi:MAG: hypothetical protein B6U73_02050 [Desulfurococcales archaeon ex4484_204]|nr:MAG: hypothetical protein B6U73_02050 [Desulfurococcales archaeon ex4484_204]